MRKLALVLGVWVATVATAAGQTTVILSAVADGDYHLSVKAGVVHLVPAKIVSPGPKPPTPKPPVPPTDLKEATTQALAAVAEYEKRSIHIRGMAFALNFLAGPVAKSQHPVAHNVSEIAAKLMGVTDEAQWKPFWDKLTPLLTACQTNAQLSAALAQVQQVVEAAIPLNAEQEVESFETFPTYGLQAEAPGFWGELLKMLLPLLVELLKGLLSDMQQMALRVIA